MSEMPNADLIKVLYIEDNPAAARLLQKRLARAGYQVELARDGEQGLAMAEAAAYDLIAVDQNLPAMDGLSVIQALAARGPYPPTIMITGAGDEGIAIEAMKLGANDYVVKDVEGGYLDLLPSVFEQNLERHRIRQELARYHQHLEEMVEERTAELQDAYRQVSELSRVKDEFISAISHELRTPITGIKLYHYLLRQSLPEPNETLDKLERETERLQYIVEELLNVARMVQETTPLNRSPINLSTLVEQYVADRTLLATERRLTLIFEGAAGLPTIKADPVQLERVLSILLANALSYTPPGGRVVVSTHAQEWAGQRWAGFSVVDSGPGILPGEQNQVFHRFFRGKASLDSGVPGTGLGLSIARGIVKRHQGRIEVKSEGVPGKGATFTVWLPVEG
jgi:signal transduction histidine kinase